MPNVTSEINSQDKESNQLKIHTKLHKDDEDAGDDHGHCHDEDNVDGSGDGVLIVLVAALYCLEAIVMHSVIVMHRALLKTNHCLLIDPAFVDRYN